MHKERYQSRMMEVQKEREQSRMPVIIALVKIPKESKMTVMTVPVEKLKCLGMRYTTYYIDAVKGASCRYDEVHNHTMHH